MSKFFELIKFLGQHWPGFCGEKNEFLKDANPLKSDEGPMIKKRKKRKENYTIVQGVYLENTGACFLKHNLK